MKKIMMKNYKNGTPTEDMLSNLDGDGNSRKHIFNAYYNEPTRQLPKLDKSAQVKTSVAS